MLVECAIGQHSDATALFFWRCVTKPYSFAVYTHLSNVVVKLFSFLCTLPVLTDHFGFVFLSNI